jgi:hypothetical protein
MGRWEIARMAEWGTHTSPPHAALEICCPLLISQPLAPGFAALARQQRQVEVRATILHRTVAAVGQVREPGGGKRN